MVFHQKTIIRQLFLIPVFLTSLAAQGIIDPSKAGQDYHIQGDYYGHYDDDSVISTQIWAQGDGGFEALICEGGFPGYGWNGLRKTVTGKSLSTGVAEFKAGAHNFKINGAISAKSGTITGVINGKKAHLQKVIRKSPSEGRKAPPGAVTLFDGTTESLINHWPGYSPNEVMTTDNYLTTQRKNLKGGTRFKNHSLHMEYRVPWMPSKRKQSRGNSGAYIQARYEIQILDSYAWDIADDHAGGIYSQKPGELNAALPPLYWQTYDVQFTHPVWAGRNKTSPAIITVWHNGVKVHNKYQLPKVTPGNSLGETADGGPFYLQQHGSSTWFRNIWVMPDSDALPMVPGCMDTHYAEYNPNADHQPAGACATKYGCMKTGYAEFDPEAAIERKGDCKELAGVRITRHKIPWVTLFNGNIEIHKKGKYEIELLTTDGRSLSTVFSNGDERVSLRPLPASAGVYLVSVRSSWGTRVVKYFHY